jgi:2-(1,2-epoxy-1,2-dihydrophenyl)acetyl-CoA isomerase
LLGVPPAARSGTSARNEGTTLTAAFGDVELTVHDDGVATVELCRPPENFFDVELIRSLGDAYASVDADPRCRAIVLCSEGRHFCAGADLSRPALGPPSDGSPWGAAVLYHEAARLIDAATPVVAAVQGAAVGGGLGLACSADFRVASTLARFSANFARLGFHHGFGLTATLPMIVGHQHACELLYTGRRLTGEEALSMGLCERVVEPDELRDAAHAMASSIASSAPLAVQSIRSTMREGLAARFRAATDREFAEQDRLRRTDDFAEGVRAAAARRDPSFKGS